MSKSLYALFIISFNRINVLKESLRTFLVLFPAESIFIIDKGSDYPPLLSFYKELSSKGVNVIYSSKMLAGADGPGGLNDLYKVIDLYKGDYDYYAVSDPDISLSGCREDILDVYAEILESSPDIKIVGPMLRIDDIPEEYPSREWCYRRHVDQFWGKQPNKIALKNGFVVFGQIAKIDSTFGLLKSTTKFQRLLTGVRVYYPYQARHLDWYITPENMTEDQIYYMNNSNELVSNWGTKHFKSAPIHPLLTDKERNIFVTESVNKDIIVTTYALPRSKVKLVFIYNIFAGISVFIIKSCTHLKYYAGRIKYHLSRYSK
jgi:hypothetical protein